MPPVLTAFLALIVRVLTPIHAISDERRPYSIFGQRFITTLIHTIALEAMTARRPAALPIEDAGDHSVGVVDCQAAHERDRALIGAHGCWPRARQA